MSETNTAMYSDIVYNYYAKMLTLSFVISLRYSKLCDGFSLKYSEVSDDIVQYEMRTLYWMPHVY